MSLDIHPLYLEDLEMVASLPIPWGKLCNKKVMLTGASGMIGSFLIDVIMLYNKKHNANITVVAICRDLEKAKKRFDKYLHNNNFEMIQHDVNVPMNHILCHGVDFVIHAASNTHPVQYASDPIGTILANTIGTYNMLNFAARCNVARFVFLSSVEIYGENRGDAELFTEDYCGYINSNTLRAGYPESKRTGESLCQAYMSQKNLDVVIPRLPRVYGPTMLKTDSKAIAQFIKKGVLGENIVLKSAGTQLYSYCYVADAVSAILMIMLSGKCGDAYNIADSQSDISLMNLAQIIAEFVGANVIFELPNEAEKVGFSTATKALLDSAKIKKIGWKANFTIERGVKRTIEILRQGVICNWIEEKT